MANRRAGRGRVALVVVGAVVLALGAGAAWVRAKARSVLQARYETHRVDFPVPFPLSDEEVAALQAERGGDPAGEEAPLDLDAIALERAVERGRHLVEARYACQACHGEDFGGGEMMDDPMIGTWLGPNLTSAGPTAGFTPSDWDRAVRHGVGPDGRGLVMPVVDFARMSDRELSDIICYLRSLPPRPDVGTPAPTLGPIGTILVATGRLVPDVAKIEDHGAPHPSEPPAAAPDAAFGRHLAQVCVGCHREDFSGGPLAFGPPDWPPAANLTPHEEGLAGWTFEDFRRAMTEGLRPDGTALREPMTDVLPVARQMTEVELRALWAALQAAAPVPTGT